MKRITHDGMKIQCINESGIKSEIERWESSIMCFVLGANPPIQVLEGFFPEDWAKYGIDKVILKPKDVFIIRFQSIFEHGVVLK